jgi:D-serine deaminase-like pyridoxal phosphate-dependent protein
MHISELDTPAIVIDLDVMERNLRRAADYARANDLRLRPHTKTHKIPALGKRQVELGAAGLTVAKVGEAEVMLGSGTPDLLVAYPIIGRRKLDRLMEVARSAKVTVSLDSVFAGRGLSDAARAAQVNVGVMAEVDMGLGRVGVKPDDALALVQGIARLPRLNFEGIAFYPGHVKTMDEKGMLQLDEVGKRLQQLLRTLKDAGYDCNVVSGGSTPALYQSHRIQGMNEIRPGTYIFNDKNTVACGACTYADCAASLLVTVVSNAVKNQVVVDGGSKTFSSDGLVTGGTAAGFGYIVQAPDAVFSKMNEEHGYINIQRAGRSFEVGDRLRIIPNHICVAMNLHETVYGVRGDQVEQVWKVEGRGKLQ